MSTYGFAGVHPIAEEIATAAMSAHPNTPVRIFAGTRYDVTPQYIDTTAAQVTLYATVSDNRDFPLETFQEQLTEAREGLESALKEAVRLAGRSTLTDSGCDCEEPGDLTVTITVETARIQEDLGNLLNTLHALQDTVEEWAR